MADLLINAMYRGGPMMWPILFCATLALLIGLHRLWMLWQADADSRSLYAAVAERLEVGDLDGALAACQRRPAAAVGQVLAEIIAEHRLGVVSLGRVADYAALAQRGRLGTHSSNLLPTVAAAAALLGLLGTVDGLIIAFSCDGCSCGPGLFGW